MTLQHQWVKHTVTKVSTIPDFDDEAQVVVVEDPDDIQAAEEGAVFGCNRCGVTLEGNHDTPCKEPTGD